MKRKGFTLIELLVVIAILSILSLVSVVGYNSFIKKAKQSNALTALTQLKDYIYGELVSKKNYLLDNGENNRLEFYLNGNIINCELNGVTNGSIDNFFSSCKDLSDIFEKGDLSIVKTDDKINKIEYTVNGETAVWNLNDNTIE